MDLPLHLVKDLTGSLPSQRPTTRTGNPQVQGTRTALGSQERAGVLKTCFHLLCVGTELGPLEPHGAVHPRTQCRAHSGSGTRGGTGHPGRQTPSSQTVCRPRKDRGVQRVKNVGVNFRTAGTAQHYGSSKQQPADCERRGSSGGHLCGPQRKSRFAGWWKGGKQGG